MGKLLESRIAALEAMLRNSAMTPNPLIREKLTQLLMRLPYEPGAPVDVEEVLAEIRGRLASDRYANLTSGARKLFMPPFVPCVAQT